MCERKYVSMCGCAHVCMYVVYCVCVSSTSERGYLWIVMQCNRASIYLSVYVREGVCKYMCVCVCMYVCMYVVYCVCVSSTSERGYVWIVMQCSRASVYPSIYVCLCERAYTRMYVCMYARMRVCVCMYMCVCMYVCMLCIVYVCHLSLSGHMYGL